MRESEVEKYLVAVVKSLGGECRKVEWIGRVGAPDRVVMLPCRTPEFVGDTYWIELKRTGRGAFPANAHERQQAREHTRMRKVGQQVYVLDSIGAIDRWAASL